MKLIPVCFVTSKMIKKLLTALYAEENILYFNEGSDDAVFNCNEMGILNIGLNNISHGDTFDKDDPDSIILIKFLAWHIKFRKCKELKKELSEELMSVTWHLDRWCDWCMPENEKKEIDPMFIEEL